MKENGKYRLLQCAFYAGHCITLSYVTYYLGTAGLSDRSIGILVAITCALGSFAQGVAGRVADCSFIFHWKRQLQLYSVLEILLSVFLLTNSSPEIRGLVFAFLILFSLMMMPMVNVAAFYYKNADKSVDFGIARGLGSLSYAVTAFIVGKATSWRGAVMIPYLNIAFSAALLFIVTSMPTVTAAQSETTKKNPADTSAALPRRSLLRTYPVFFITVIGIMLFVFFNNMVTIYMIRILENVGGDSGNLGVALAIAACAELPMLFLYSRLAKHVGAAKLIAISGFFFSLKGILLILAPNVQTIYAVQLLQSVSFGLLVAAKAHYADICMADGDKVTGQSIMSMTESMGSVLASLAGGLLMGSGGIMLLLWCATGAAIAGTLITGLSHCAKNSKI